MGFGPILFFSIRLIFVPFACFAGCFRFCYEADVLLLFYTHRELNSDADCVLSITEGHAIDSDRC